MKKYINIIRALILVLLFAAPLPAQTIDFIDSFDHYSTSHFTSKWTTAGTSSTISSTNGRRSTNSFRAIGGSQSFLTKSLATARSTICAAFGFRVAVAPTSTGVLLEFNNSGTNHVDIRLLTDLRLQATRNSTVLGTSTNSITTGSFYHLETCATIDDSAGTVETKVNESSSGWLNLTSQDTRNGATTTVNEIVVKMTQSVSSFDIDDLIVASDFVGDKTIKARFCTGDGNYSQWTKSGGATNCSTVDETTPNDDTDYVATSTVGNIDTYTFSTPAAGEVVTAVAVNFRVKKSDAGTASVAPLVRAGGTDHAGTDFNPSDSSYLYNQQIYQTNPQGGAAWSDSNWAEFGIKRTN